MWSVQSEKMKQVKIKKERVNFVISKEYREQFKKVAQKDMRKYSNIIEASILRYVKERF